ncbi:Holliday junction resolvase [Caldalkalibacillus uzonensis]|uniref:Holliday junction resolvase n=1 Tax=Caldalkalibacillus uzonensis TaxID=353224 RepID=A0ABU0CV03_9BACI|nr:VRR-NUC domain-containing protein [Caldalkalibacillus uzonensis]MDQ0340251.1 Holliday junction resolvase [Caldalkalibacillus uzonensis]
MSQKESTIQKKIVDYINSLPGCKAVVNHGSAWQGAGRPDIFACCWGRFVALEVKTETGELTRLQMHELSKWMDSGAVVAVVRSVEDVKKILGEEKTDG